MELTINGEARTVGGDAITVRDLLETLGMGCRRVAVEQNRAIVPRAQHATALVADGDVIEVVSFVGGG